MPRFKRYEQALLDEGNLELVVGIDEAGRGSWAGPLSIAAVVYSPKIQKLKGLNDSKLLTQAKREELYAKITKDLVWAHEFIDVDFIDRNGLTKSLSHGFENLIVKLEKALKQKLGLILIDGKQKWNLSRKSDSIIAGDTCIRSIAAASIIAKVRRDRLMKLMSNEFRGYGFAENVGYGTVRHKLGLNKHGITPIHRLSFEPIKSLL